MQGLVKLFCVITKSIGSCNKLVYRCQPSACQLYSSPALQLAHLGACYPQIPLVLESFSCLIQMLILLFLSEAMFWVHNCHLDKFNCTVNFFRMMNEKQRKRSDSCARIVSLHCCLQYIAGLKVLEGKLILKMV